jgi:hypothetical protein
MMSTVSSSSLQPTENPPTRSAGLLLFAWFFVGVPLAWGVTQTIIKSMALFH